MRGSLEALNPSLMIYKLFDVSVISNTYLYNIYSTYVEKTQIKTFLLVFSLFDPISAANIVCSDELTGSGLREQGKKKIKVQVKQYYAKRLLFKLKHVPVPLPS